MLHGISGPACAGRRPTAHARWSALSFRRSGPV